MKTSFLFKNFTDAEKKLFENYFNEKIGQIEKFLGKYEEDQVFLKVRSERFATKNAYKVSFNLSVPKKSLLVSEDDHTISEAIDLAKDKLMVQLKKLKR